MTCKKYCFCLFLISMLVLSACAHKKNKDINQEVQKKEVQKGEQGKVVLEVNHFLLKAVGDAETLLLDLTKEKENIDVVSVSKFPAQVAFAVVPGEYIPKYEEKYPLISTFSGEGTLKGGLVLPVELIKWRKELRRTGQVPKRDEKGSGVSLRFEASEKENGQLTLCTSLWYSQINGEIWGSESAGLLAADPKFPKVLWNLPTEMKVGETTLFVIRSPEKNLTALISLAAKKK